MAIATVIITYRSRSLVIALVGLTRGSVASVNRADRLPSIARPSNSNSKILQVRTAYLSDIQPLLRADMLELVEARAFVLSGKARMLSTAGYTPLY
jgi:hypothetical protein